MSRSPRWPLCAPAVISPKVSAILQRIEQAARAADEPLMPLFVEAVENDATVGEICDALRAVFGEYQPASWV